MPRHYNVRVGSVPTAPEPEVPSDWAEAFATRDFAGTEPVRVGDTTPPGGLLNWYMANTGHDPSLVYQTISGTLTVDAAWLANNNGNGRVWQEGGRWIVERYRITGILRAAANDVTFRNIFVDSAGSLYGFQSREIDGNASGIILEHSTLAGNGASDNGATLNFPAARGENQIIIRYCDISGFRAGLYIFGGITAEYNWVHDLHFSEGSHNTGASIRAGNAILRRNLITDGNSSAVSFYPEYTPYTNVLVEENALKLMAGIGGDPYVGDTGAEALLAAGRLASDPLEGETRIIRNNLFFRGGNRGEGGGIGGYMAGFTEVSGNFDRYGAAVGQAIGDQIGTVGARPTVTSRPSATNTGIRVSTTQTLTGPQAMSQILSIPEDSQGRRVLRRARITGNLNLDGAQGEHLVFEDCEIESSTIYTISAFYQAGITPPAIWPEFHYCTISGGTSATVRGGYVRFLRCDMSRGVDILKPFMPMEVWASHLHDAYRSAGAHCDLIQIVSGVSGGLFHYNNFYGFTAADSPEDPSSWVSGNVQFGTMVGPVGVPDPVQFIGNWVEGARFGLRGTGGSGDNPDNYAVSTFFRGNRFIRDSFQYGPVGNMGVFDDFDSSNVWDDTNTPVMEV